VIDADDVTDDGLVCGVGGMGAPTVSVEKILRGDELFNTVRVLESHLGASFEAIIVEEIGGSNGLEPIICALQMGLPIVDGDGMGRAFPELQMDNFAIGGLDLCPLALGDCHGNQVIFQKMSSAIQVERYARTVTIEMGGSATVAMPVMTGLQLKKLLVRKTLSLAKKLGDTVLKARKEGTDPINGIVQITHGQVLFRGKISDVDRRITSGFSRGKMTLVAFGDSEDELKIDFQNENLIAYRNGNVVCTVPDLITVVDIESGEPIGTEMLRYGLRVAILGMPAPVEMKTSEALAVVGPEAFGYPEVSFRPLPGNLL